MKSLSQIVLPCATFALAWSLLACSATIVDEPIAPTLRTAGLSALPGGSTPMEAKWQPATDYDTDGCYPTPAINSSGTIAPGLKNSGSLNGNCRDESDLNSTNSYSRFLCNNGWCAYLYDYYFEKDQAIAGSFDFVGHRHDLEHIIVWVKDDKAEYVSVSQHSSHETKPASQVRWEGTHPKIVYHKEGLGTHNFRFATSNDEPPENHKHTWQYPTLIGWDFFPPEIRQKLVSANFGRASLSIKDGAFADKLADAKPDRIPFDPLGAHSIR